MNCVHYNMQLQNNINIEKRRWKCGSKEIIFKLIKNIKI